MRGRRLRRAFLTDMPAKLICLAAAASCFSSTGPTRSRERFFSVPLEVNVPAGLAVASAYPKSVRITLRGTEEQIYPVLEEDVEAVVGLESRKSPGVFRASVKVTRKGTAASVEPLEVKVEPHEITFTLEPLVEKRVPVMPDLRGAPAYGYEMVQTMVSPPTAVVRGAKSRVQGITALSTEEIDLTGRSASFTTKLKVGLPSQLVRIAGDPAVEFRATIQEAVHLEGCRGGAAHAGRPVAPVHGPGTAGVGAPGGARARSFSWMAYGRTRSVSCSNARSSSARVSMSCTPGPRHRRA